MYRIPSWIHPSPIYLRGLPYRVYELLDVNSMCPVNVLSMDASAMEVIDVDALPDISDDEVIDLVDSSDDESDSDIEDVTPTETPLAPASSVTAEISRILRTGVDDTPALVLPDGFVIVLNSGPANRPPGTRKTLQMSLKQRLRRSGRLSKRSNANALVNNPVSRVARSSSRNNLAITSVHIDYMTKFIYLNGVSQKIVSHENCKIFALYENRVKTFEKCEKSLLQEVPSLCETGLYYKGFGNDDIMSCYCCGTNFKEWKYLVNPWVQHAILSPECSLLLLYKGRQFVEQVHQAYDYVLNCDVWSFQELFYGLFSRFDLGLMDSNMGYGDRYSRCQCIDQLVSVKMLRFAPDSLPQTSINLNKPPLPNGITCKICFREKIDVLFIPCGHLFACVQCSVSLNECALCKEPFGPCTYALRVTMEEEVDEENDQSTTTNNDSDSDAAKCIICKKETIGTVYLPCLHANSCYPCAMTSDKCPVCSQSFIGILQVFL